VGVSSDSSSDWGTTRRFRFSGGVVSAVYDLTTAVDVDAPPERVWATLLDFDAYPDWNPLLRVRGRPNVGARLDVEYTTGGRTVRFRPTVTVCDRRRELCWQRHRYVRGLFDGEHRFRVDPVGDGRSRFAQAESFSGVLAPLLFRLVRDSTRSDFEAMNAALKRRAEAEHTADDAPRPS
jgi:hypothetical protein